jgi:hypothetical protein
VTATGAFVAAIAAAAAILPAIMIRNMVTTSALPGVKSR